MASGPAFENYDVPDHAYIDGWNTEVAIATLKDMQEKDADKPFFLALGFKLPHLNWVAPTKYWNLYDREKIELATQVTGPENGARIGLHPSFELRVRANIPKIGPMGDELSRHASARLLRQRQLRRRQHRQDDRCIGRGRCTRRHHHHRLGVIMAGTSAKWASGARLPTTKSPPAFR